MQFNDQLKIERAAVVVITLAMLIGAYVAAHLEIATWTF
jgi:hypothetical protein